MRLVWLNAAVTSWRQIALESLGFGVLTLAVTVILTQRSFEALVILEPLAAASEHHPQLAQTLCGALRHNAGAPGVRLSAELSAPGQCALSCRAEQLPAARESCKRVVAETRSRLPPVRVVQASASLPGSDNALRYGLFSPLAALVWLLLRARLDHERHERRGDEAEPDGYWTVQHESQASNDTERIAPSFRAPAPVRQRVRTLSGLQPLAAAASQPAAAVTLNTRVVFQVGGNPHTPDSHVLTSRSLQQLRELSEELLASEARQRVIRVASGVSSRYAKTQVAAQLAALLAQHPDTQVVVVEGDVDAPALHKGMQLEAPVGLGFSEQLQRLVRQQATSGTLSIIRAYGSLHALVESRASAAETLASPLYTRVIEKLRSEYAFVVVDGPVLDNWPDVTHLSGCVDSVVWVTAAGTRVRDSLALSEQHFKPDDVMHVVAADDWVATG